MDLIRMNSLLSGMFYTCLLSSFGESDFKPAASFFDFLDNYSFREWGMGVSYYYCIAINFFH